MHSSLKWSYLEEILDILLVFVQNYKQYFFTQTRIPPEIDLVFQGTLHWKSSCKPAVHHTAYRHGALCSKQWSSWKATHKQAKYSLPSMELINGAILNLDWQQHTFLISYFRQATRSSVAGKQRKKPTSVRSAIYLGQPGKIREEITTTKLHMQVIQNWCNRFTTMKVQNNLSFSYLQQATLFLHLSALSSSSGLNMTAKSPF